MSVLSPYRMAGSLDNNSNSQKTVELGSQPFVSLLEFVSEVYQVSILFFCNMYYWMELLNANSSSEAWIFP